MVGSEKRTSTYAPMDAAVVVVMVMVVVSLKFSSE